MEDYLSESYLNLLFESSTPLLKQVIGIDQLIKSKLPKDKMIIGGSGTLALYGLRKNHDLDVSVTSDVFKKLAKKYPVTKSMLGNEKIELTEIVEIFNNNVGIIKDTVKELIERSITINGFHFMSFEDLLRWKKKFGREKDLKDVKLIEEFLRRSK